MKLNCELPLSMLDRNTELNDYDFVLFHLLEKDVRYYEYYRELRETEDRIMILDCSAYEYFVRGEELDIDRYIEVIKLFHPEYYILPDVLMGKEATKKKVLEFLGKMSPEFLDYTGYPSPMGVIQGNSEADLLDMMEFYKKHGIYHICIPFHNSFFKNVMFEEAPLDLRNIFVTSFRQFADKDIELTEDIKYAIGRVWFVEKHRKELEEFVYIHLLGSHCVWEKHMLDNEKYMLDDEYCIVNSMDTGYPVKCGVIGYELFDEPEKPNLIIDDFFRKKKLNEELIEKNIRMFRNL